MQMIRDTHEMPNIFENIIIGGWSKLILFILSTSCIFSAKSLDEENNIDEYNIKKIDFSKELKTRIESTYSLFFAFLLK